MDKTDAIQTRELAPPCAGDSALCIPDPVGWAVYMAYALLVFSLLSYAIWPMAVWGLLLPSLLLSIFLLKRMISVLSLRRRRSKEDPSVSYSYSFRLAWRMGLWKTLPLGLVAGIMWIICCNTADRYGMTSELFGHIANFWLLVCIHIFFHGVWFKA